MFLLCVCVYWFSSINYSFVFKFCTLTLVWWGYTCLSICKCNYVIIRNLIVSLPCLDQKEYSSLLYQKLWAYFYLLKLDLLEFPSSCWASLTCRVHLPWCASTHCIRFLLWHTWHKPIERIVSWFNSAISEPSQSFEFSNFHWGISTNI